MTPTRCRPNWQPSPRSSPAAARPLDAVTLRLGRQYRPCRDHPERARRRLSRSGPRRALAAEAGADGITAHLREDRRHITDDDIDRLMAEIGLPLNLEMAATEEMLGIALAHRPHAACIVPEKREERTTEGGLDAAGQFETLRPFVERLGEAGIRVSLFIEPSERQVDAALRLGAPVVEFHTGRFAHVTGEAQARN